MRILKLPFATVICIYLLVGCAHKEIAPTADISKAEMALKEVMDRDASTNAPLELKAAEDKLKDAREAMKKGEFKKARRLAEEAEVDAKMAESKSDAVKEQKHAEEMRNTALEHARSVVSQAQSDPDVEQYAKVEAYEAAQALQKAENAKDSETMLHYAYIAEKDAQIAVNRSLEKKADKEMEDLNKEREKIQVEAREYELAKARKEVEEKTREAALKGQEAKEKTREACAIAHKPEMARLQVQQENDQRQQLQSELGELETKQAERGLVITLGDLLFETGKAGLLSGTMLSIDKIAEALKKYPSRNVLIEGHTDSRGGETYNLHLSEQRANAVRSALLDRGIAAARITLKSYGKMYPIAGNEDEFGRQKNRRVEIVILDEGDSPGKALR